jgi:hypothetical protein
MQAILNHLIENHYIVRRYIVGLSDARFSFAETLNQLFGFQQFPDRQSVSQAPLRTSGKPISESREWIVSGQNILAFHLGACTLIDPTPSRPKPF